jgi:hypothetical protein
VLLRNSTLVTGEDEGKIGLTTPVDAVAALRQILDNRHVTVVGVGVASSDLRIHSRYRMPVPLDAIWSRVFSLGSVVARSRQIDPAGKGISEAAILHNQDARCYYQQHRSWRSRSGKRAREHTVYTGNVAALIKAERDVARVRYRYLKLSKAELVERLLASVNTQKRPYMNT